MDGIKLETTVSVDPANIKALIEAADIKYWISSWTWRDDGGSTLTVSGDGDRDPQYGRSFTVDAKQFADGLQTMAREEPGHFVDFMTDNFDSITGDVYIQICVFGEARYG